MQHRWLASLALAALGVAPAVAAAERPAFSIGAQPAWFVTAGVTAGGTVATGARGGFAGGDVSLVRLREARFLGLYVDAYYDFGVDGTYLTAGPEAGWIRRSRSFPIALGIDGGGAVRRTDEWSFGATGRVFVTFLGLLSIYGRYAYLDAAEDDHVVQVGLTFKMPLGPAR